MNDIIERLRALPPRVNLDTILIGCAEMAASRIHLQTDTSLKIRVHGRNYTVPDLRWTGREVSDALAKMYKSSTGPSRLSQAMAIDTSYIIWPDRTKRRYGFRVNAVASTIGSNDGIGAILRPLPEKPTPLEEQYVEPRLAEALDGETGGYLVCGVTGSGKTTLMGGVTRQRLEDPNCHCDIVEGAAPLDRSMIGSNRTTPAFSKRKFHGNWQLSPTSSARPCARNPPISISASVVIPKRWSPPFRPSSRGIGP